MKRVKRFYKSVSIGQQSDSSWSLFLDGRKVRTPLGAEMIVPSEHFAGAIATEWEIQNSGFIIPNTMPITTMAMTTIDIDSKVSKQEKKAQILKYFQTDTIRFPDKDEGSALWAEQNLKWVNVYEYLLSSFSINVTKNTIGDISVPATVSLELIEFDNQILSNFNEWELTAIETSSKFLKSASIAISLVNGVLSPSEALEAAQVEETVQQREWGLVEGEHDLSQSEMLLWLNGAQLLCKTLRIH